MKYKRAAGSGGQGALEYLIIVAAVLAIAAIVVLFLTGAFRGQQGAGNVAICKDAASRCNVDLSTSSGLAACSYCDTSCVSTGITALSPYTTPAAACHAGAADKITSA